MKAALLLFGFIITVAAHSQMTFRHLYCKTELIAHSANGFKPGSTISGGFLFRDKISQRTNAVLGVGAGFIVFDKNSKPYFPIFIEAGYFDNYKNVTPYLLCKAGYGIYKGSVDFVKQAGEGKGSLYTNIRGGVSISVSRHFILSPFIGISYIIVCDTGIENNKEIYKNIFDAGLSISVFN